MKNNVRQKIKSQAASKSRLVMSYGLCVGFCNMGITTGLLFPFASDY